MTSWLRALAAMAGSLAVHCPVALAQSGDLDGAPIVDLRLRAEHVDQAGLEHTSALTLRGRLGYELKSDSGWSGLVEFEAVGHLNDDFSDSVRTVPGKAVVPDPEAAELNRLQIGWKNDVLDATVGRQRIIFDDARFMGNVGFRQNEQTFDAVRAGWTAARDIFVTYVYIDKVHRIFGDESPVGEFESDSHVLRLVAKMALGELVVTGLFLDFDESAAASGRTLSIAWSKSWKQDGWDVGLSTRLAQQDEDRGKGPAAALGYQSYTLSLGRTPVSFIGGLEILEGSGGQGFATPLATLHAFQGWADAFLNTPAAGVRDLSLGVRGAGLEVFPNAKPASWTLTYHDFDSDNGALDYGAEFDAVFRVPLNDHFAMEAKAAAFDGGASAFADRTKFWLSLEAGF